MQNIEVDKKRSLKRLAERNDKPNNYPIEESDLLFIEGCNLCGSSNTSRISELYLNRELNFFSTDACNECLYTFRSISPSFKWFEKRWEDIADGKLEVYNPLVEEIRERNYEKFLCYGIMLYGMILYFSRIKVILQNKI